MKPSNLYHIRYFHLKNALKVKLGKKILDVGCGGGELTQEIASVSPKSEFIGCDLYPRKKEFIKCNAEKLKFDNKSFDNVFMFDVLEHLVSPEKAISEIYRVLKPKGVFHLVVPLEKNIFGVNLREKPIGHIQQFDLKDIKNLLQTHGFKIQKINYSYYFIYRFLSFVYFFYATYFKKGKYVQLLPDKKHKKLLLLKPLVILGGLIINLENYIWGSLGVSGQTVHITSVKD